MINNYNNGLIARKADGEILMFNEDGDWGNHFKEVKEFLDRNGKGAVLDKHGIAEPRKPKDALKRRKGHVNRYGRLIIDERHEDERIISRYNEACVRWKADCHVVMGCVKRSLGVQVNHFLELTMKDTKTASRKNILALEEACHQEYGKWTPARGKRNYMAQLQLPNFTSPEHVQQGFIKLKVLKEERERWQDVNQQYPDGHYRAILISKIQDWDVFSYLRNVISDNLALTSVEIQTKILKLMKDLREQQQEKSYNQKELASYMIGGKTEPQIKSIDSTNYTGNQLSIPNISDEQIMELGRQSYQAQFA